MFSDAGKAIVRSFRGPNDRILSQMEYGVAMEGLKAMSVENGARSGVFMLCECRRHAS